MKESDEFVKLRAPVGSMSVQISIVACSRERYLSFISSFQIVVKIRIRKWRSERTGVLFGAEPTGQMIDDALL